MATKTKISQKMVLLGLAVALIFVVAGVFCFSYALETLDVQAKVLGAEEQPIYEAPFPDYNIIGLENEWGALVVGVVSTLLLFVAGLVAAKVLSKKKS